MHELPESIVLARQLRETVLGREISSAVANSSPHKFAWYHGDPEFYGELLRSKVFDNAVAFGSYVELQAGSTFLALCEGATVRFLDVQEKRPAKHQLLIEFSDGTALVSTVRMYGGIFCFEKETFANSYYDISKGAVSPLEEAFDYSYFKSLHPKEPKSLSVKAFLATEQRIPGLGNGVLQDILFNARLHPKRKIVTLNEAEWQKLFRAVKETLAAMRDQGGRDVEKDLFDKSGAYLTILSAKTVGKPCLECGQEIKREAYLGGNVYYCPHCQTL